MKPWNPWHHETYETMKPLTPRNLWNHETIDTTKPMKPWNHWHHETYETMKPLTPRNHETLDTAKPMKPWNNCHHETYETMKPLTPRSLWNHETYEPMKPETIDCTYKPWLRDTFIIWHRHWHILISIISCIVTPSNNPVHRPWGGVVLVFTELVALAKMKINFCKLKTSLSRNFVYNLQTFLRFF